MKHIISLAFLAIITLYACKEQKKTESISQEKTLAIAPVSTETIERAVIYEANIRQYSPEGTFDAFTKDIPVLKELGVKIIWVMPINPISEIKRKATGDKFTSDIEDDALRSKYLGSYYSVSEYKAINPEFGTLEDFKQLVATAHEHGIYVIVDWVPNHTGWDHPWITEHPEWYTQDSNGTIIDPLDDKTGEPYGWDDVADLNYDNLDMRKAMISDLKYWITEADIDGYRMDVAHQVPVDFFETATAELKEIKPVFMLAEAEQADLLKQAFDMHYGWEVHHIFNKLAKGSAKASDFQNYMQKVDTILEPDDIVMHFVTNHDENSWNGTLKERMPENKALFTALTYTMPGMPLIYSGQEYDLEHALKFFEKDSIPKTKGDYFSLLEQLGKLKQNNEALAAGLNGGAYLPLGLNESLIAFSRRKGNNEVVFVGNISQENQEVQVPLEGKFQDYFTSEFVDLGGDVIILQPNDFRILVKK